MNEASRFICSSLSQLKAREYSSLKSSSHQGLRVRGPVFSSDFGFSGGASAISSVATAALDADESRSAPVAAARTSLGAGKLRRGGGGGLRLVVAAALSLESCASEATSEDATGTAERADAAVRDGGADTTAAREGGFGGPG